MKYGVKIQPGKFSTETGVPEPPNNDGFWVDYVIVRTPGPFSAYSGAAWFHTYDKALSFARGKVAGKERIGVPYYDDLAIQPV